MRGDVVGRCVPDRNDHARGNEIIDGVEGPRQFGSESHHGNSSATESEQSGQFTSVRCA